MLLSFWQDFFPDHMVSISSETNGMVDHSQLIEVLSSYVYHALSLFLGGSCEALSLCHSVGVLT